MNTKRAYKIVLSPNGPGYHVYKKSWTGFWSFQHYFVTEKEAKSWMYDDVMNVYDDRYYNSNGTPVA